MLNLKKPWILLALCSMSLLAFCFNASNKNDDNETEIFRNVRKSLIYMHYSPKKIDDNYSKDVYKKYMEDIDPNKRFFLQSDMNEFNQFELKMDDMFNDEDVSFYHLTIDKLYERINQTDQYVKEIFNEPFDFKKDDYLIVDEKKRTYPKNEKEAKEEWRKYIKFNVLQEIFNSKNKDLDSLQQKLNSDDSSEEESPKPSKNIKVEKQKTDAEIEKEAIAKVKEDLTEYFRRLKIRKKSDWFSIFINAYTEVFDPHTSYFSPKEKEDFSSSISGKIIGIGALLEDKKGYPTIKEVVIGGPAWKSKKIEVGDKILKVQQGKNGKPVNIVGMLLDDAIRLIRGELGSTVVLTMEKKDGSTKIISLVREEIESQETFVRSAVLTDEKGDRYGIIYLPEFYVDMDNNKGRDCSDDVKNEILELKKQNIQGLILDLRNNGGGSLPEVCQIAGLFLGNKQAVVQVKSSDGKTKTLDSGDTKQVWDGPLTLMVNELSASASEILAGVLQDYHRAVIVGSPQTYGKGTVQTIFPFDRFSFSDDDKLGAIKITVQKFYRVTGSSTQLKGVNSDIVIPDLYTKSDIYEKNQEYALPWDQIQSLSFTPWTQQNLNYNDLKLRSEARLKRSPYLSSINEISNWTNEINKTEKIPLNYNKFMDEMKIRNDKAKQFDKDIKFDSKLKVETTTYELQKFKVDTVLKAKRENWYKGMKKDFNLRETVNILNDIRNK